MAKTPNIDLREEYGRNYVINGNFDFWQRNTSFVLTPGGANRKYDADRFSATDFFNTGQITISRDTDVPTQAIGAIYSRKLLIDTTVTLSNISHYAATHATFEGDIIRPLIGKMATLTFWVKTTIAGDFSLVISASNPDSPTDRYLTKYTVNAANTWEKKKITFYMDPSKPFYQPNGLGMNITFGIAGNSNVRDASAETWLASSQAYILTSADRPDMLAAGNSMKLSQVMLTEGEGDISFRTAGRNFAEELQLCQRYFEKSWPHDVLQAGIGGRGYPIYIMPFAYASVYIPIMYKATKRVATSITLYSPNTTNSGVVVESGTGDVTATVVVGDVWGFSAINKISGNFGAGQTVSFHWSSDAEL